MLLTLAAPSLAAPARPAGPEQSGRSVVVAAVLVVDQRPDDGLGRDAVQLLADRPDELGARRR